MPLWAQQSLQWNIMIVSAPIKTHNLKPTESSHDTFDSVCHSITGSLMEVVLSPVLIDAIFFDMSGSVL